MPSHARILRQALIAAFAELRTVYTWKTWTFGWLSRLIFQVTFFALVGHLVGAEDGVRYLLIGNAVVLVAMEACVVIISSVEERQAGTLPLLVAAPAGFLVVFLGRGLHWLATGLVSSTVTLFLLAPLFGVPVGWPRALLVIPLLACIGLSAYCFGAFVAALVLRCMPLRWMALNASYLTLMTVTGVNVPVSFWADWIQVLSRALPVTHGLAAVRALLDGGAAATVLSGALLELAVGAVWLLVAALSMDLLARHGRRTGAIEFGV